MFTYFDLSDKELFTLLQARDEKAFAEIYKRYWLLLYPYAIKFTIQNDQAEDIVQEVFISLWRRAGELKSTTSLAGFLYKSARYKIFDLMDHEKVRANYRSSLGAFLDADDKIADSMLIEKEFVEEIESAIQMLPAKMRKVFELSRKDGLSQKQIAVQLNISDKTVKKQVNNAIKILRLNLNKLMTVLIFF